MKQFIKYGLLLIVGLLGVLLWQGYSYYTMPLSSEADNIVMVNHGDTLRGIGQDLYHKNVIPSVDMFVFWARVFNHHKSLKTGEYAIPAGASMADLFAILKSGKSIGYKIVVPEGSNMFEIAQFLENANLCKGVDFLKLVRSRQFTRGLVGEEVDTLEGYLFPDTYFFTKVDGAKLIAQKMVQRFMDKYKRVPQREGWSRHQVVTLASIIEKETGAPEERPLISSVFHNRLRKDMRLQTDPTVLYSKLLRTGNLQTNISRVDLVTDAPYNTYTRKGLPPGPIANPGVEAMTAAVSPENSPFLFFVSRNDGTHVFTETYKDHSKAVGTFQLDPKARAGKSWRDLNKKKK